MRQNIDKYINQIGFFNCILPLYLLGGVLVFPLLQYQMVDTMYYIDIAKKYWIGDFKNALNGYWSPLISWILAPFLSLEIRPVLILKGINFGIGGMILYQIHSLCLRFKIQHKIYLLGLLVSLPIVWFYAPIYAGADILASFFILWIANLSIRYDFEKWTKSIILGLVAGLGYLSKAYFLPFFSMYFFILFFIKIIQSFKKKVIPHYILVMGVFLGIALLWTNQVKHKYEYFSLSYSSNYNIQLSSPHRAELVQYYCLLPLPNPTAFAYWEDPASYRNFKEVWSPFDSWSAFKFEIKTIFTNLNEFIWISFRNNPLWIFTVLGVLLIIFEKRRFKAILNQDLFKIWCCAILSVAGYLLLFLHDRYIFIWFFMLMFFQIVVLDWLLKKGIFNAFQKTLIGIVFGASIFFIPIEKIFRHANTGKESWEIAENRIVKALELKKPTRVTTIEINGIYQMAAYHLGWKFYGFLDWKFKEAEETVIEAALQASEVDYVLVNKQGKAYQFLSKYPEVTGGKVDAFLLYQLKD